MKKLIILAVALFAFNVSAYEVEEPLKIDCPMFHKISKAVMEARQSGHEVTLVIEYFEAAKLSSFKFLILEAYKRPRYMGEQLQERAITEFANDIFLQCEKLREEK
ncbi:MAG: hypothetical protein K0U08_05440 [Proteobacteria bacterium]|nr:hypothetical protein [Pseudomonadota bacterium]